MYESLFLCSFSLSVLIQRLYSNFYIRTYVIGDINLLRRSFPSNKKLKKKSRCYRRFPGRDTCFQILCQFVLPIFHYGGVYTFCQITNINY